MKVTERVAKLKGMSVEELDQRNAEIAEQLFRLRLQWSMGQTETLNKMRELRRDRARVETIRREKAKGTS
ncbi:MAG TPA: 50S ribosomal protein L29 [Terriglobia bacterium]|nr:50S ribosomal protein L29 [Terriglobia bacterium]